MEKLQNLLSEDAVCKTGFVSIVGRSNVGKSTLLNAMIGEKIAITSDKPQTTRSRIKGIYNDENSQIVFLDTPGVQKPKNKLGSYMEKEVKSSSSSADVILYVVDESENIGKLDNSIIESLKKSKQPKIIAINKIDKLNEEKIFQLIKMYDEIGIFDDIVPISAIKKKNVSELIETIKKYLVYGPKYFPDGISTDQSNKVMISEIVREKILNYTDKEIPHGTAVEVEKIFDNKQKNMIEISVVIYCERDSHKKIIIGKNGRKLKGIGKSARVELEEIFGCKVFLETWVKVKENWRENSNYIREFGYIEEK
ncbi:GTP-binding protein Era [Peptoanaerobacter stomatis]|uniref:GTPase Era n=1 Tax=Peptoanaerobacter stomatis TaxID=796937 RepID=J4W846_9FIRM|nr:GTPase Era [Peptoanaerobacter stomatis]EJU21986.1 GTP-binding protein Era [Peptoanaerobacter stomatis]NWO24814.1 GTPase Era [Peptostreptococcaceae bacterium oral taxon 081]